MGGLVMGEHLSCSVSITANDSAGAAVSSGYRELLIPWNSDPMSDLPSFDHPSDGLQAPDRLQLYSFPTPNGVKCRLRWRDRTAL